MHCKYCGQILKKKDKECPNCNHIIGENDINYSKKNNNWILILIIILLIAIVIGGYYDVNVLN